MDLKIPERTGDKIISNDYDMGRFFSTDICDKSNMQVRTKKKYNLIVYLRVSISTKKAYANEPQRKGIFKVISELLFMWDSNQFVISESQGVSVS